MIRIVIDLLLIFLIPFAIYALYRAMAERDPKAAFRMTHGPFIRLAIAGVLLCIVAIVYAALREPDHDGGYERARWENGKLIDGRVKP